MRNFKLKAFGRFARRERITDDMLCDAVAAAEEGLIDADLGSGLVKLRIARPGKGKSGGYRTLLAYRAGNRAVFLYGFAKSERDNIDDAMLAALERRAAALLSAHINVLENMIVDDEVREVHCE